MSKFPFDRCIREKFLAARSAYKSACRTAEKSFRQNLTNRLMNMGLNNPKAFWQTVNEMNNWGRSKDDPADRIAPGQWKKHFVALLNGGQDLIPKTEGYNTFDPVLDGIVTLEELRKVLKKMKLGKSAGLDGVLAEYFKVFAEIAETILLMLLRKLFANGIYPTEWTVNILKPIYKKGEVSDTNNFRGLAIGPALAKIHSLIMLERLTKFVEAQKLISPNQIGFMKGCRTSDHILLLQTMIEKIVKKGKRKLFCAFVDYKKAYDTVDRNILIKRLQQIGINGIFLNNVISMYTKTEYSIKLKDGYIEPIKSNLGLKQGCPLSPILFNIYIDHVKDIFDESCEPIDIHGKLINHFLYADDLVLASNSSSGLQNSLSKLQGFSKSIGLEISIKKTKIIIFNQAGRLLNDENFHIDNQALEIVQTFCYLGFDVRASGCVSAALTNLYEKARKAMRPLLGVISRFNIPVKTSIKLFDTYIAPIALYTCENWLVFGNKKIETFSGTTIFDCDLKLDLLHRRFLRFIMGVSKSTPNLGVYGDCGEVPLSLRAYRLYLRYWIRTCNLPGDSLVKLALLENVEMRTNWIKTIEHLIRSLGLIERVHNPKVFYRALDRNVSQGYIDFWENGLKENVPSRLIFYSGVKEKFSFEPYLDLTDFRLRKVTAKLRCSDHALEIEKGRHKKIDRTARLCKVCDKREIETEDHFLKHCEIYSNLRNLYEIPSTLTSTSIFKDLDPKVIGNFLLDAWSERNDKLNSL